VVAWRPPIGRPAIESEVVSNVLDVIRNNILVLLISIRQHIFVVILSQGGFMGRSRIAPVATTEDVLVRLGQHIATARMRREWRQEDLAQKAGIHPNTLRKVESGAPGTAMGAYASALWALGLLEHLAEVARPGRDAEGETLAAARLGDRVRNTTTLDDNF
jgi:hypothetical protein